MKGDLFAWNVVLLWLVGAHLADVHSTAVALAAGGVEQTPRIAAMLQGSDVTVFWVWKLVMLLQVCGLLAVLVIYQPRFMRAAMLVAWMGGWPAALVAVSNYQLALRLMQ